MSADATLDDVRRLYERLLDRWNARDASGFAALFVDDGHIVGFDGSQADSAAEIAAHLGGVFESHATAAYVAKVREVRRLPADAGLLRAVVGMVPPGGSDINPAVNSIQSLVAVRDAERWRVVLLQTTPAAFHGRPDLAEALTAELRALLPR
ncbi:MAG TPA: SgcJ/EcaC family oxidoreductase [Chloroflexota bacterium]|jgi:uncharacterized protein (TIGR02246 family)